MLWRCCGDAVAMLWRCCGDAVAMLWRCCGDAVAMLWRCCGCSILHSGKRGDKVVQVTDAGAGAPTVNAQDESDVRPKTHRRLSSKRLPTSTSVASNTFSKSSPEHRAQTAPTTRAETLDHDGTAASSADGTNGIPGPTLLFPIVAVMDVLGKTLAPLVSAHDWVRSSLCTAIVHLGSHFACGSRLGPHTRA
jgi:hypothetical protein